MKKVFRGLSFYLILIVGIFLFVTLVFNGQENIKQLSTSEFMTAINSGEVVSISEGEQNFKGKLKNGELYETRIGDLIFVPAGLDIYKRIQNGEIKEYISDKPQNTFAYLNLFIPIIMLVLFFVFWFVFMQNSQGGGSRVMSFGKSRAKLHKDDEKKITFDDVAGLDEEKEELAEVVDFLKTPKKYWDLGARIPKGILMVGPPGTGKTYLTKAVAGEAGVPFFSISGSDFVEMFVGVGASRVRDLFENAKKNSPCIVFIDEIDAVGRKRGAGLGGGHDEREQTLNQLLVEMDGFSENQGIIIIAATNRPDILDPALQRPGRFDRQITVGLPDIAAREAILAVHTKNKPISRTVSLKTVARATSGFTPADLENLLNEAAILTARENDKQINMKHIDEAIIKVMMGVEKKSRVSTERDRRITAYHEGGHALLAKLIPDTDPVHQVTIIGRGRAGGFTLRLPDNDDQYVTKVQLENRIVVALGGRIAEKLIFKDVSTGASGDLDHVTKVARAMVTKYAMSENLSQMSYDTGEEVFLGRDMSQSKEFSEQVLAEVDREISVIVDTLYERALTLMKDNLEKLHIIADALLEYETINGEEFDAVLERGIDAVQEIRNKNDGVMTASVFKEDTVSESDPKVDEGDDEASQTDKAEDTGSEA